jgi:DNA polymerase III subunit gamma/tau
MTSQALYNRWRSQTFDDVLGQDHITGTLRNQIRANRIGHAYLFTGLRGTGKTSMARIMAKAVNCVGETDNPPCNVCHMCVSITAGRSLDLLEIDAASNRGIDEMRELRERVGFVPHEARYKVYVIDEVHMLTKEASNALLKTLEEPPPHVIFILCTTEPHRLLDTILSRCQRFDFHRASVQVLLAKLQQICSGEAIDASPGALEYIARRAAGSFRDAESLLEHVATHADRIDTELVQHLLGAASAELVTDLIAAMLDGDAGSGLRLINQAMDQGVDPRQLIGEILDQLRGLLLISVRSEQALIALGPGTVEALRLLTQHDAFSAPFLLQAIRSFSDAAQGLRNAVRIQLPLELALVETIIALESAAPVAARPAGPVAADAAPSVATAHGLPPASRAPEVRVAQAPVEIRASAPEAQGPADRQVLPVVAEYPSGERTRTVAEPRRPDESADFPVLQDSSLEPAPDPGLTAGPAVSVEWARGKWTQIISRMGTVDRSTQAILRSTYPLRVSGDTIILGCESDFHRERLAEQKRLAVVEQVISAVLESPCHIQCIREDIKTLLEQGRGDVSTDDHLFSRMDRKTQREQELLNHPAVKALEQRGGQVTRVDLVDDESK